MSNRKSNDVLRRKVEKFVARVAEVEPELNLVKKHLPVLAKTVRALRRIR